LALDLGGLGGKVFTLGPIVVIVGVELTTSNFSLSRFINLSIPEKLFELSLSMYSSEMLLPSALIGKMTILEFVSF